MKFWGVWICNTHNEWVPFDWGFGSRDEAEWTVAMWKMKVHFASDPFTYRQYEEEDCETAPTIKPANR